MTAEHDALIAEAPALVAHLNALAGAQMLPDSDGNFGPTVTGNALLNAAEMIERLASALAASDAARVAAERERDASDNALVGICEAHGLKFLAGTVTQQCLDAARARKEPASARVFTPAELGVDFTLSQETLDKIDEIERQADETARAIKIDPQVFRKQEPGNG